MKSKNLAGIIMGSDSDLPIMSDAAKILDEFQVPYELTIASAHRSPDRLIEYAKSAKNRGLKIIIAAAGGAAHLAGVTAALTTIPVIGVPIKSKSLDGLDSLLSIVQMPPGIPVATVSINGATNAGLLAIEILATSDKLLSKKLDNYKKKLRDTIQQKANALEKKGYKQYLEDTKK